MPDWLAPRRTAACDRVLDAAGELFAARGVAAVGMNDIARAAGCSRATLYRYFDNREALYSAYVHREARTLNRRIAEMAHGISDPSERLLAAMTNALALVRENPSLSAWFARTPAGAEAAEESAVVQAMSAGFLLSLGHADVAAAQRWARWLVRALASLLSVPGRDADDERAMLTELVAGCVLTVRS
ncbi:MAG: helix-turn-helix domain-containing protein [Mycobacteriaceae bacterium]